MDNQDVFVDSPIQATLHNTVSSKTHTRQFAYTRKFNWFSIHRGRSNNNIQMGETIKVMANLLGATTFILGILANLNNLLSVALACVGVVWGIVKCLEKYEDYQLKKWERLQREDEKKRKIRKAS
jgi:hypothetical protein